MNNLIQLRKARAPLQRNICVKQLLILLNVAGGENFESVLVKVSNHFGVGSAFFAGIVEWGAAGSHAPGLVD